MNVCVDTRLLPETEVQRRRQVCAGTTSSVYCGDHAQPGQGGRQRKTSQVPQDSIDAHVGPSTLDRIWSLHFRNDEKKHGNIQ
jgi:hypothetical protein